jgi:hypothetical protein
MILSSMQEFQTMVVFKEKAKSWNLPLEPSKFYTLLYIFGNYSSAQPGSNVWENIFYGDLLHVKRLLTKTSSDVS